MSYHQNNLEYPQKFSQYAYHQDRLGKDDLTTIKDDLTTIAANQDWTIDEEKLQKYRARFNYKH